MPQQRSKTLAALAAAAIQLGIAWVLVKGLAFSGKDTPDTAELSATLVTVTPTPTPEPEPPAPAPEPSPAASKDPGAANRKAEPLPRVAPKAKIELPPKLPAAPVAAQGTQADAGAATRPGPGTGAAGAGSGLGAGGSGSGSGAGSGGGSGAQHVAGRLRDSDYPREAEAIRATGTVAIRYIVRPDGLVDRCAVLRSSGHPMLDQLTCRLVQQRYRYRPARDGSGRPVEQEIRTTFTWGVR
jgi:periplasmic protein TonB